MLAAAFAGLCAGVALVTVTVAQPASAADSGGVITTDTVWTADHGPYTVATPVQIPTGVTLTVMPGTVIHVTGGLFRIAGSWKVQGTASQPVIIDGSGTLTESASDDLNISIDHALIKGYSNLFDTAGRLDAHVAVTNSRVFNASVNDFALTSFVHGTLLLDHNELVNTAGFFIFGDVFGGAVPATITNNRFVSSGTASSQPLLTLPQGVKFHGNSFSPGAWPVVEGHNIFADSAVHVDATGNYWGTTDSTAIAARISDYNDNISNPVIVDYDPFLSAASSATLFEPLAPGTPTAQRASKSATVAWTAPASDGGAPITGYTVTAAPGGQTVTVPGDARTATVPGLADGTAYTFTVAATNIAGTSLPSSASNPVTPASAPSAPSGVTAAAGDGQAVVSWTPPTAGADTVTGYTVTSSPGNRTASVPAGTLTATVTGLDNGTAYTFTVVAKNQVGSSDPSQPSTEVTPVGKPAKVAKPQAAVKRSTVTLKWAAPDDGGTPIVKYVVTAAKAGSKMVAGSKTTAVFKGLKKGIYSFKVVAYNSVGASAASVPVKVKVQ